MIDLDAIRARLARVAGKWPTTGVLAPGADEFGPKAWSAHGPLRCHATERGRDRQWTQACADAEFVAHAPADIAALVAEVERLRAEVEQMRLTVAALRASVPPTHPSDYGHEVWSAALRAEVAAERAAVVAWLREHEGRVRPVAWEILSAAADCIERGEHRREEEG
jgi:hypothetical protein